MPNALRTATPMGDWRSFKFTCEETDGWLGIKDAWAAGSPWLYLVEDTVGALLESVDFGDEGVLIYHAEKILVATSRLPMTVPTTGSALRRSPRRQPKSSSRSTSTAIMPRSKWFSPDEVK
jgi:hypothetical protein